MTEKVKIVIDVAAKGLNKINNSLDSFVVKAGAAAAALATAFAIKGAFDAAKEVERLETQLGILLKSTTAASNQLKELQKFAATTPFQLVGIAEATTQLLAFGFEQETIIENLKVLGDVAAGSGSDLKEVALIFGQVAAAGKLTGERLLQFQERAIPIGAALAKSLGVAESSVKDLVSEGKVGFKEFEEAFKSLSAEGGLFAGATEKLSKTVGGVLSTLSDNFFNLQAVIGKTFSPLIIVGANNLIKIIQQLTLTVAESSLIITKSFISVTRQLSEFVAIGIRVFQVFSVGFKIINVAAAALIATIAQLALVFANFIELLLIDGDFSQGLRDFGETSGKVLEENIKPLAEGLNSLFDPLTFSEKSSAFLAELESFVAQQEAIAQSGIEAQKRVQDESLKTAQVTSKALANIINTAVVQTTSRGIQAMTQSLVSGANAFREFGKQVFSILGDLSIKLGETLILAGIGIESLKSLSGGAAIAAGAGLIALGAILKGLGSGPGLGGAAAPGPGPAGPDIGGAPGSLAETGGVTEEAPVPTTLVTVNVDTVLDGDDSGMRIVELINDAFDSQGVVLNSGVIG